MSSSPTVADEAPAPAAGDDLHRRIRYLPQLDGVRAVAVLAVMAYHAELGWLPGGFLGVDVFFALSGYLITTLLIVEREQEGSISLRAFWGRRARRLLPALYAVLLAVALFGVLWATDVQAARLRGDGLASLFYVANWRLVLSEQSYFDIFEPSPLRHMWSLAIEEQWYLLWPVVASVGLARVGRRTGDLARWILVAALGSAVLMAVIARGDDHSRAYYGTDTRAQTLLLGTAAALWLHRRVLTERQARLAQWGGVAGTWILLVCFLAVHDGDRWMYRGGFLLVAAAAVAVITSAVLPGASFTRPLLAAAPLAWVGRISYGLYLWHWPIFVLMDESRTGLDGAWLVAARFTATFAVSLLSYHHLEMPVRRGALAGRAGVLGAVVAAAVVSVAIVVATIGAALPEVDLELGSAADGDLRVLVVGDSVAFGLASQFPADELADTAVHNAGIYACGLFDAEALLGTPAGGRRLYDHDRCLYLRRSAWDEAIATFDPHVTVMELGIYERFDYEVDGEALAFGSEAWRAYAHEELGRRVEDLTAAGGTVAVMTPHCIQGGEAEKNAVLGEVARRLVDAHDRTALVDLTGLLCPDLAYSPTLDGTRLYRDGRHFNEAGAELVWRWLLPQLQPLRAQAD